MRGEYSEDLRWTQVLLRCSRGGVGWSGCARNLVRTCSWLLLLSSSFLSFLVSGVGCRVCFILSCCAISSYRYPGNCARCPVNNTANFFLVGFRRAVIAAQWSPCPERTAHSSSPRSRRLPSSRYSRTRSHTVTRLSRPACSCLRLRRKQGPYGRLVPARPAGWPRLAEACGNLRRDLA